MDFLQKVASVKGTLRAEKLPKLLVVLIKIKTVYQRL
jgi:hypothetical protein